MSAAGTHWGTRMRLVRSFNLSLQTRSVCHEPRNNFFTLPQFWLVKT